MFVTFVGIKYSKLMLYVYIYIYIPIYIIYTYAVCVLCIEFNDIFERRVIQKVDI